MKMSSLARKVLTESGVVDYDQDYELVWVIDKLLTRFSINALVKVVSKSLDFATYEKTLYGLGSWARRDAGFGVTDDVRPVYVYFTCNFLTGDFAFNDWRSIVALNDIVKEYGFDFFEYSVIVANARGVNSIPYVYAVAKSEVDNAINRMTIRNEHICSLSDIKHEPANINHNTLEQWNTFKAHVS